MFDNPLFLFLMTDHGPLHSVRILIIFTSKHSEIDKMTEQDGATRIHSRKARACMLTYLLHFFSRCNTNRTRSIIYIDLPTIVRAIFLFRVEANSRKFHKVTILSVVNVIFCL